MHGVKMTFDEVLRNLNPGCRNEKGSAVRANPFRHVLHPDMKVFQASCISTKFNHKRTHTLWSLEVTYWNAT